MEYLVYVGLAIVSHLAALGAGGYLHYRFGAATVKAAQAVEDAFKGK